MALEYRLTLAGHTALDDLARRVTPDPAERATGEPPVLSVNLRHSHGFDLTIRAGKNGYVSAQQADDDWWEWELDDYVALTFRMDKFADHAWEVDNMLIVVRRVLETGTEDAALVFNGDILLLTRLTGRLVKYRRDGWWASYPAADEALPG